MFQLKSIKQEKTAPTHTMKLEIFKRAQAGEESSGLGHVVQLSRFTIWNIKHNGKTYVQLPY